MKKITKPRRKASEKPDFESQQALEYQRQLAYEERSAFDSYASAVLNGLATKFTWDEMKANASFVALASARIAGEMLKARRLELGMKEDT